MTALDALRWSTFSATAEEQTSTEGKAGVPRFDGDASRLSEYNFRVRMRQAREKAMSEEEIKKLGPLALRLVDGLRGPALQVARNLPVDELSKDKGVEFLLKSLTESLRPRSKQEARELYQAGAQNGGVLSRQRGESIPSYVLRRQAWYRMMTDLDEDLKLPDGILCEQLLANAGLSEDHRLLIRTAIGGNMEWSKVCEELIAQHGRIHEREARGGGFSKGYKPTAFKGHGKGGYNNNKGKGWRSYYVNEDAETQDNWENASQSLGGYEDVIDDATAYNSEAAETYVDEELDPMLMAFQSMVDEGLDENDMESVEHAAEILQAESEVYHARLRAQETGHYGFWGDGKGGQSRHFQVHGSLSVEEKKQRIQALKAKSSCRRCGQMGHWSNDPQCPKGGRKGGKSKGTSTSTLSTATSKGGKTGKKDSKPRTVFFAINEYQQTTEDAYTSYMVVRDNATGKSADELLDEMIAQAQQNQQRRATTMLANQAYEIRNPMDEHAALVAVGGGPTLTSWRPSQERLNYLDVFMEVVNNRADPEGQDAYAERWNEIVPGHPLFGEADMNNLLRWKRKAQLGLPALPEMTAHMMPIPEDEMDADLFGDPDELRLRRELGIDPEQTPGSYPTPTPLTPVQDCAHVRTTKQGSNDHRRVVKCKDCGLVLEEEKLTPGEKMRVEVPAGCAHAEKDYRGTTGTTWRWTCKLCGHKESGAKSPGESARYASSRSAGSVSPTPTTPIPTPSVAASPSSATSDEDKDVDKIVDLVRHVVDVQREMGQNVSITHLDRIYDKCRSAVVNDPRRSSPPERTSSARAAAAARSRSGSAPRPGNATPTSVAPSPEPEPEVDVRAMDGNVMYSGTYYGRTYVDIYDHEMNYVRAMIGKLRNGSLSNPHIINFAKYAYRRRQKDFPEQYPPSPSAFMMTEDKMTVDEGKQQILAILDTGCNNTCHGDRWMQKFAEINGYMPEITEAAGQFRGVGGKVSVAGKRTIPMRMQSLDNELIDGTIASIELQDSDAPLLLSAAAQQTLGLVLDLGNNTIYSRTLDKELEMVMYNGLPSIVLHPGEAHVGSIALNTLDASVFKQVSDDETTQDDDVIVEYDDTDLDTEPYCPNTGGSQYMPISEGQVKIMNRKQRRHLQESLHNIEKEDCALWSTLSSEYKRPRRMLPRGCKSFLMEIFAGAATLSCLAVNMGLSISPPIDVIYDDRYDLLKKANRDHLERLIEEEDPFLLTLAPICGPWSSWQHVNMSKDEMTREKILQQRKDWYPVMQWMAKIIRSRLAKGREVLAENPWPSMIWRLRCLEDLITEPVYNAITDEPLELVRIDQCMYGLMDEQSGLPNQKATGLLLSSRRMKELLQLRCDRSHWHQQLEGGSRTKKAQQWPETLCFSIIMGAVEEMKNQVMQIAFATEAAQEEQEEMGPLDGVYGPEDLEEMPAKRRRIDLDELDREEDYEEREPDKAEELVAYKEKVRRENWLRIRKDQRVAIRRLHAMMGHCSREALTRMLRASGCDKHVIKAAQYFRCPSCDEIKNQDKPRVVKPMLEPHRMQFNKEVSIDVFEIHDAQDARHTVLSMVDIATHYQIGIRLGAGGTPSSKVCAEAMNTAWFTPFGAPGSVVTDQGVHNSGKVRGLLLAHGVDVRRIGAQAPHQLGIGERHGGLMKTIMKKAIHNRQLIGADAISALCAETARIKNVTINFGGFSPAQWVLGHTPTDWSSLVSHDGESQLGVHQNLVDMEEEKTPQESFMIQLLIRQAAKEAYMQVDSCQKIRKAMLRKAAPIRGPYRIGNMVNFERKGKWYGPARVLAYEGRSSLWLVHGGVTILVAETSCRPSSTEEIFKKNVLEQWPIRKRRYELISPEEDNPMEQVPFSRDGDEARHLRPRYDGQAPFVDVITGNVPSMDPPSQGPQQVPPPPGMAAIPDGQHGEGADQGALPSQHLQEPTDNPDFEVMTPPGLTDDDMVPSPSLISTLSGQPESEAHPETVRSEEASTPHAAVPVHSEVPQPAELPQQPVQPPQVYQPPRPAPGANPADLPINQALRRGAGALDGHPRSYVAYEEDKQWAFLATREEKTVQKKVKKFAKRNQKKGAGREVTFEKQTPEIQEKLKESRVKEWTNWKNYTNGRWISEAEFQQMKKDNPKLRAIPTRWVEVDKAEVGQEPIMKSRIVVRGDLEDSSRMRTDSPTCSQLMMSLLFILSACRDVCLWAGDISAAFLQGSTLDRILVLKMPKGLPDDCPGDYYVVSTTVYGTKDAPRGWYKNLFATMVELGMRPVPHEAAAFVLNNKDGGIAGLAIVHVDDILWTGGPEIEAKMQEVIKRYKFGKIEQNVIKYCGRQVVKDETGVHVTCPSLIDRVKPIYMGVQERKNKLGAVTESYRQQLRSVIGSLAWLSRVCRPDLAYGVSYLQSRVTQATYGDVSFANKLISIARSSKDTGLHYPLKTFNFEQAMIVGMQDASFANDATDTKKGPMLLVDWHSTTVKRVCRSTLQAETMSLLSGMEEGEHLRMVLHGLLRDHHRYDKTWQIEAMDMIPMHLFTDCRSLEEYVNQAGLHTTSDKRLAIDLTGIRQQVWRKQHEETGDPLITDKVPENGTTKLHWTNTTKMAADCLTKAMRPGSLSSVMDGGWLDLTPEKQNGCENEGMHMARKDLQVNTPGTCSTASLSESGSAKRRVHARSDESQTREGRSPGGAVPRILLPDFRVLEPVAVPLTQTSQATTMLALTYFKGRAAKNGIAWILRFTAAATLDTLEAFGSLGSRAELLMASDDALKLAQEMLSNCEAQQGQQGQQVQMQICWKTFISILNLMRDNSHRALRLIQEAVSSARTLPFSEQQKLLVLVLRTQQMVHLLRGESAAEITKEVEAESTWDSQHGPFLDFLRLLFQQIQQSDRPADLAGRLCFIDFLAFKLRGCLHEAKAVANDVLDVGDGFTYGLAILFLGKLQLRSSEGLRCLKEACASFGGFGAKEAEAAALQATATAWLVQELPNPSAAIDAAQRSEVFFQELGDLRGEAIALQTASNCRFILKDTAGAVDAAYKSLRLFTECGDEHGRNMVVKLLQSLGQTQQQLQEAMSKSPTTVSVDTSRPSHTPEKEPVKSVKSEEQRQREEHLKNIMEEQVVFEYAWVPSETQDPKNFGEKRSTSSGSRKVFVASELRDQKLLNQLAACRAKRGSSSKKPYFVNLMNGRLLTSSSLQTAMEASSCASVVYDVTKLNHMTPLEVADVAIRLTQALQVIEETYALDVILASTQNIASAKGIRTPFHSTLWGFCRTANIENPTKEFRVLDVDAGRWKEDLAFITRYLMGAQSTRPTEAIVRNGGLQVSRLVSARMKLQPPLKIDG
eukprot:s466_g28.t2